MKSIVSVPTGLNRRPMILGYFTLTVAHVPYVEWVAKNVPSTGDGIGGYMTLWAPSQDLVARFVELKTPQF
jgi:hypothetical protein